MRVPRRERRPVELLAVTRDVQEDPDLAAGIFPAQIVLPAVMPDEFWNYFGARFEQWWNRRDRSLATVPQADVYAEDPVMAMDDGGGVPFGTVLANMYAEIAAEWNHHF